MSAPPPTTSAAARAARTFAGAWEAAVDYSLYRIEEDAFTRSRRGVARPIFYKGEQVGEWRHMTSA